MTLAELLAMAEKGVEDCPPPVVAALVRVAMAAQGLLELAYERDESWRSVFVPDAEQALRALEAALNPASPAASSLGGKS